MKFSERQIALKSRTLDLIKESGKSHSDIIKECPSINSIQYLSNLLSSKASGRTLNKTHLNEIASAIEYDVSLFWSGISGPGGEISEEHSDYQINPPDPEEMDEWHGQMYDSLKGFLERKSAELQLDEEDRAFLLDIDFRGNTKHPDFNDEFWEWLLRNYRKNLKHKKFD